MSPIAPPPTRLPARVWPWACGLALIVCVVFGTSLRFDFLHWDDPQQVLQNPNVNRPSWQGVWASWRGPYWGLYIPASYTVLAFEAAIAERVDPLSGLSELRPSVFHLGNVLLHAACTVLVFVLLRKVLITLRCDQEASRPSEMSTSVAAGLGALLFAVHPLQVESVAWISEVRGLLCSLFALLTLWQYVEYATYENKCAVGVPALAGIPAKAGTPTARSSKMRALLYAGATVAFLLALLSKPAAAAVPLMAAVLGVGLLRRRPAVVLLETSPWFACAGAATWITKRLQPDAATTFVPSLATRPLVALDAISFYVAKFFLPLQLGADYGRTPRFVLSTASFQIGWVLLPILVVVLVLVRHRRVPLVGFALFLAWLVPVLGLVPFHFQRISTVADRYAYLALLGPALVVAWIVRRCWSWPLAAVAAVPLVVLAALSFLQLGTWHDTRALFTHALRVNPRSAVARYHLGYQAFFDGDRDAAIKWYGESLDFRPDFVETHIGLAQAYYASGRIDDAVRVLNKPRPKDISAADWERAHETRIAMQSKQNELRETGEEIERGVAEQKVGRVAEARRHFLAAIRIEPWNWRAHYNLGNLALSERNWTEAIEHYETALKFHSEYAQARANLAAALLQLRRLPEAITQARAALIIDRGLWPARMTIGEALLLSGSKDQAAAEFRTALGQVPPGSPDAAVIQGWLRKAEGQ